jgi:hypothetical protein
MGGFFAELARKLSERWVALLAVPGLLFVAAAWVGAQLGWAHALDLHLLGERATAAGATLGTRSGPTQALVAAGLLLASAGVGLVVQALTGVVRAGWLGQWPPGLRWAARRRTAARSERWHRLVAERKRLQQAQPRASRTPEQQASIDAVARRINRISLAPPARPTWMGDRVAAVEQIAQERYGLDLHFGWSRLWLVLPDTTRAELAAANGQFAATVVTGAWTLPYLALGVLWWPALLVAASTALTGWTRARAAIAELTNLSEAALDLHGRALATAVGVAKAEATGPLDPAEGEEITRRLRKGR